MRIALVLGVIGHLLRLFSLAFAVPLVLGLFEGERWEALYFGIGMLAAALVGSLLARSFRRPVVFRRSEAFAVVAGTWLVVGHFAAIPYILDGLAPVDALFESISGFTTTGATILTDFALHGRSFFLWRAMTQWFGGLGVIALFVVVLPRLGIAGRQLFFAEASDASSEAISPQVRQSARRLWVLYIGLTALEASLLMWSGFGFYDALVHSFTTMAAGGFSPHPLSVMGYNNPSAEWIIVVFMVLAGASFTLLYKGFTRRPTAFLRDGEFLLYVGTMTAGALLVALLVADGLPGEHELRAGFFQSASLISSTGFASENYDLWSDAVKAVLVLVMLMGGCAGSAAGGAKVVRHLLVFKFLRREITQTLHPRAVISIRHSGREVPPEILRSVFTLVVLFLLGYLLIGATVVVVEPHSEVGLSTGFSAALACLGNIGPGFGLVGPMGSYAELDAFSKIVLTLGMWIGRLEILCVLALLHPHVWRNLSWRGRAGE